MRNLFTIQNGKRYLSIILGNLLITGAYAFITVPNKIVNGGVRFWRSYLHQSDVPGGLYHPSYFCCFAIFSW